MIEIKGYGNLLLPRYSLLLANFAGRKIRRFPTRSLRKAPPSGHRTSNTYR